MVLLRRVDDVEELREVGGQVVVVHDGRLLALNRVGTRIWDYLDQPRAPEEVVDALRQAWPGAPVDEDVGPFIARLRDLGIVVEA